MSEAVSDTLGMFLFLALELSILFLVVSFLVGLLRRRLPATTIERWLGDGRPRSYLLAAGLGAITPFCSCSTIPMLKGLIDARAGFGPMMVFLFTSPLLNPIVVVLLAATFGLKLTAIYFLAALLFSLASGWLLLRLGFRREIRAEVDTADGCESAGAISGGDCCAVTAGIAVAAMPSCSGAPDNLLSQTCTDSGPTTEAAATSCDDRTKTRRAPSPAYVTWKDTWADFRSVLPYLILGVAIGSLIYGFVPSDLLERFAGAHSPWSVPVAAVIGIPLYLRAEALIPIAGALMAKGVAAGTVLALIIGGAGASLTELILLRALFTYRLIAVFVLVVLLMAITAGFFALAVSPR